MAEVNVSDEISALEKKREALECLISVVNSLETMSEGLKASMELGKNAEALPLELLKAYNNLGKKVRNSPDAEILARIGTLDSLVKNKLNSILLIIQDREWAFFEEETRKNNSLLFDEIGNFVRLTHTNIALRVLIEKRTGRVLPFKNYVDGAVIRQHIEQIDRHEAEGRKKVVQDIDVILRDVNGLLKIPGLTQSMQHHLEGVKNDLKNGLRHIISGKPIKSLPVDIAVLTLTPVESPVTTVVDSSPIEGDGIIPLVEVDESSATQLKPQSKEPSRNDSESEVMLDESADDAPESGQLNRSPQSTDPQRTGLQSTDLQRTDLQRTDLQRTAHGRRVLSKGRHVSKRSFWQKFWSWLNSPWATSWKDIKEDDKTEK